MERNTFNISFYVQKTRVAKNGEVPVMLRVTVNGLRAETSVNLKVNPKKWNAVAGRSVGDSRKDDEVNARLDTIRMRVMQIHREMEIDREKISAQKVIDRYLGRDEKPVIMLLDLFREHNEKCRKLSGNGMAPGTVERYETSLKHGNILENFFANVMRQVKEPARFEFSNQPFHQSPADAVRMALDCCRFCGSGVDPFGRLSKTPPRRE